MSLAARRVALEVARDESLERGPEDWWWGWPAQPLGADAFSDANGADAVIPPYALVGAEADAHASVAADSDADADATGDDDAFADARADADAYATDDAFSDVFADSRANARADVNADVNADAAADADADAFSNVDANAYADADAFADAHAFASAHADADALAYAHSNPNADAFAAADDDTTATIEQPSLSTRGLSVRPGLYLYTAPSSESVAVLRVAWLRHASGDPDPLEYEACHSVTPQRGEYQTMLVDAQDTPPGGWKYTAPLKRPSPIHRAQIRNPVALDEAGWARVCPKPKDWGTP
jgi:hypothetical protein